MKNLIMLCSVLLVFVAQGQEKALTEKVWRVNFINPGIELELPVSQNSTFSTNLGIGYNGSYPELTVGSDSGIVYIIAPFMDVQYKYLYNFEKRLSKGNNIKGNSGNFISARIITRGNSIADNVNRTSDIDFAIGPTWGIQRKYGKLHLLFDAGPQFYSDLKGNNGFWPIMLQLNIGLNL